MLYLEPFWVYASVGICVACGRRQLQKVEDIWGNFYFTSIILMISVVFVPVESWILLRHTDWETTFVLQSAADSAILAFAPLVHVVIALLSYFVSISLLKRNGPDAVIKSSMWAFSAFFATQGIFYDSLMYAGNYTEYHAGVQYSFTDFIFTDKFRDCYLIFFCLFGPFFYYICISWNSGCTKAEKGEFMGKLFQEIGQHTAIVAIGYTAAALSGMFPPKYDVSRLGIILLMHLVPHMLVVLPLYLSPTVNEGEEKKED